MMIDLYRTLEDLKKRPTLYLGGYSIFRLESFIRGYFYVKQEMKCILTEQERDFEGFQDWIRERLQIKTDRSWSKIIFLGSSDERQALDRFFELFEEFKNRT